MKLLLTDYRDGTVGMFPKHYDLDCPFEKDEVDKIDLDEFKNSIVQVYKEYFEGRISAKYDFEME